MFSRTSSGICNLVFNTTLRAKISTLERSNIFVSGSRFGLGLKVTVAVYVAAFSEVGVLWCESSFA